ncbi:MAG: YdcF family protein, partial [Elusimicrobia bacterium]|nr:YdcF family protein [Elusimicrobiota bacterium]
GYFQIGAAFGFAAQPSRQLAPWQKALLFTAYVPNFLLHALYNLFIWFAPLITFSPRRFESIRDTFDEQLIRLRDAFHELNDPNADERAERTLAHLWLAPIDGQPERDWIWRDAIETMVDEVITDNIPLSDIERLHGLRQFAAWSIHDESRPPRPAPGRLPASAHRNRIQPDSAVYVVNERPERFGTNTVLAGDERHLSIALTYEIRDRMMIIRRIERVDGDGLTADPVITRQLLERTIAAARRAGLTAVRMVTAGEIIDESPGIPPFVAQANYARLPYRLGFRLQPAAPRPTGLVWELPLVPADRSEAGETVGIGAGLMAPDTRTAYRIRTAGDPDSLHARTVFAPDFEFLQTLRPRAFLRAHRGTLLQQSVRALGVAAIWLSMLALPLIAAAFVPSDMLRLGVVAIGYFQIGAAFGFAADPFRTLRPWQKALLFTAYVPNVVVHAVYNFFVWFAPLVTEPPAFELEPAERRALMADGQPIADFLGDRSITLKRLATRTPVDDPLTANPDVIMVFGVGNALLAERTAHIYVEARRRGLNPRVVFAGGIGRATPPAWVAEGKKEAVALSEAFMAEIGRIAPALAAQAQAALIIEDESTNSGQNVLNTLKKFGEEGVTPTSILLVHNPLFQLRSALATWLRQSGMNIPTVSFAPYRVDFARMTDAQLFAAAEFALGEIHRLRTYPAQGFTVTIDLYTVEEAEARLRATIDGIRARMAGQTLPDANEQIGQTVEFGRAQAKDVWAPSVAAAYPHVDSDIRIIPPAGGEAVPVNDVYGPLFSAVEAWSDGQTLAKPALEIGRTIDMQKRTIVCRGIEKNPDCPVAIMAEEARAFSRFFPGYKVTIVTQGVGAAKGMIRYYDDVRATRNRIIPDAPADEAPFVSLDAAIEEAERAPRSAAGS